MARFLNRYTAQVVPPPIAHRPTVPVNPQPLHVLQFRYPAAVQPCYDALEVQAARAPSPSKNPIHVFDTHDGLRLIVSRERHPTGDVVVHISASFNSPEIAARPAAGLLTWIIDTWQHIANSTAIPQLVKVSDGGVPHFVVKQVN